MKATRKVSKAIARKYVAMRAREDAAAGHPWTRAELAERLQNPGIWTDAEAVYAWHLETEQIALRYGFMFVEFSK
jgi:transposase